MTTWTSVRCLTGDNPNVAKYVFASDDAVAEAVLYAYPTFNERTVICCSTMSGCPVGCRFCGSGDSFVRNLDPFEIIEQVTHLIRDNAIDAGSVKKLQIMFMSMGEPMLNFDSLRIAIRVLHGTYPSAQLLISTMGPKRASWTDLIWLSQEIEQVGLQFSIHESTDEARDKLIPFAGKLPLADISWLGQAWSSATGRRPFFNYCARADNTSRDDAGRLVDLFPPKVWNCTVSVVCERGEHVAAANERQRKLARDFSQMIFNLGYNVRTFDPAGQDDIGGGCGQLWHVQKWMREHPELVSPSVGRGLSALHSPKEVLP